MRIEFIHRAAISWAVCAQMQYREVDTEYNFKSVAYLYITLSLCVCVCVCVFFRKGTKMEGDQKMVR